jgi:hypothetical protein
LLYERLGQDDKAKSGAAKKSLRQFFERLRIVTSTFRATLREIFDENAYERFLQRTQTSPSVESYRAFLQEREAITLRKPRCC